MWYFKRLMPSETGEDRVIEIPFPLLEYINVWFFEDGKLVASHRSGSQRPQQERPIRANSFAFPVYPSDKPVDIVIAIKTSTLLNFEVRLWDKNIWDESKVTHKVWHGFILGIVAVLMGYNLLIGISLRNMSYIYYVCFVLFMTGLLMMLAGIIMDLNSFKPKHGRLIDFFVFGVIFFGIAFCNRFLEAKQWAPKSVKFSYLIPAVSFTIMVLGYFAVTNRFLTALSPLTIICGFLYTAYLSSRAYIRGIKRARFVVLSFVSMLSGLLIFFVILAGIINKGVATHLVEITSMVSIVVLAVALSDHINFIHNEKIAADHRLIEVQQDFTQAVITTQEQEREKFSLVLHDGIAHSLLILKERINKLARKTKQVADEHANVAEMVSLVDSESALLKLQCEEIIEDTRRLSHDLHPHVLKRLGLKAAIKSTLTKAFANSDVDWHLDANVLCNEASGCCDSESAQPSKRLQLTRSENCVHFSNQESEILVYRIVQEALNNILKYAEASEVLIRFYFANKQLMIEIKDDGVGFLYDHNKMGAGMSIMEGRVQLLGGTMQVKTEINQGVTLVFGIPIHEQ